MKSSHPAGLLYHIASLLLVALTLQACASPTTRYSLVEKSLRSGDPKGAATVIADAEDEYGSKSRVLYGMDRGMTLHLAHEYDASNTHLEEAEQEAEELYTRRVSTEVTAFLTSDTQLPFEGAPFEQVWLNVIKAINYALQQEWDEALVEARRIDHRLNVLSDQVDDDSEYHDDPFARYLSGMLYEAAGDLNNAFIAYRNAYEGYQSALSWSGTPVPPMLRADLLRVTEGLHLTEEHRTYREQFSETSWQPWEQTRDLARVIVISYNGLAPQLQDEFVDLPLSPEAIQVVVATKAATGDSSDARAAESILYGMTGRVVRVALPKLVSQKTDVAYTRLVLSGNPDMVEGTTELVYDLTAAARKTLDDRYEAVATKAVARAATKFAIAEGLQYGATHAGGDKYGPLIGLLVGIFAKSIAIASEEADKRSWRTLPDEVQVGRLWVPPGDYELHTETVSEDIGIVVKASLRSLSLGRGDTRFFVQRVLP